MMPVPVRRQHVLACAVALALPTSLGATPNHAHHHYHMGVRAYAGTRHASMLHHEASAPALDFILARENALAMETLADELHRRANRLERVVSDAERAAIGPMLASMAASALAARRGAAEMGVWLDDALTAGEEFDHDALAARIVARCRLLFAGFRQILLTHKEAERTLGIPVPDDPPAP